MESTLMVCPWSPGPMVDFLYGTQPAWTHFVNPKGRNPHWKQEVLRHMLKGQRHGSMHTWTMPTGFNLLYSKHVAQLVQNPYHSSKSLGGGSDQPRVSLTHTFTWSSGSLWPFRLATRFQYWGLSQTFLIILNACNQCVSVFNTYVV